MRIAFDGELIVFAKFAVALVISGGIIFAIGVTGVPAAPVSDGVAVGLTPTGPTMLADEINRRLSRLGISFNRLRIPHPYDPVGEVC